jgi:hypothetical protein
VVDCQHVPASSADESRRYLGDTSETDSTDETSGAPIGRSNTASLERLSDIYSLEEMQYMCTEFDSYRGVTVEHINKLTVNVYMDMFEEQQCEHLAFDAGRLVAHADSILQDEFNGFSIAEDGTDAVCPGDIHSIRVGSDYYPAYPDEESEECFPMCASDVCRAKMKVFAPSGDFVAVVVAPD